MCFEHLSRRTGSVEEVLLAVVDDFDDLRAKDGHCAVLADFERRGVEIIILAE